MGRLLKETVAVPIRIRQELLERMDELLDEDPRFSSRAEYVLFCVQEAYGSIIGEIALRLTTFKEERTQSVFDQMVEDKLTEISMRVGENRSIFDRFEGHSSIVQLRMSVEFSQDLNLLCSMLSVKRVDFFKYSIIEFGAIFDRFSLKRESLKVRRSGMGNEYVELKMGEAWREAISKKVESNVKSNRLSIGFRERLSLAFKDGIMVI